MKKLMFAFALIMLMCGSAFAVECFSAKGSAVVTGVRIVNYGATNNDQSEITVSNISNTSVTCKVTVFDHAGTDITSNCKVFSGKYNGDIGSSLIASGTGTFELPAGNTRLVSVWNENANAVVYGHAVIEWTSADNRLRKALIASLRTIARNGSANYCTHTMANSGQPF